MHVNRLARPQRYDSVDFLYVGRILPHKGLHVILRALPDSVSLRVVGEFRDAKYEERIRRLCVGKNVELLGAVDDSQLASLYQSARFTLVPSVSNFEGIHYKRPELLGLVALESLACGTPVVGSRVGGLGEVLAWAGQTACRPGDVDDWNAAMLNCLSGESIARADQVNVTWSATATRCLEAYVS